MDIMKQIADYQEIFWINPKKGSNGNCPFTMADIEDAQARLARFAPYIQKAFPETESTGGIIESSLVEIPKMKKAMGDNFPGRLFLKCDSNLAVSGSIKARGGIYEVLKFAEKVAMEAGMLTLDDDYSKLAGDEFKELFSKYSVAVGSTGNLGLSIGIISAKLGFDVTVHMSSDARQWKKELLRKKGAKVVEYEDDYQKAVAEGRKAAEGNPMCHFVDDEGSQDLFLGYSVAAKRIVKQFEDNNIICDEKHPVYVYIPCGVGGAPGGVTFGLREVFGEHLHVFFAEPTHAPCMTIGMISGLHDGICVGDLGIDGKTDADGLAVGRASRLVGTVMDDLLDGCYTIGDEKLYPFLSMLYDEEGIFIEPSSCASFIGPAQVCEYDKTISENATHIIWATGGAMVPQDEKDKYYQMGKNL